jgi:hypothetical protein
MTCTHTYESSCYCNIAKRVQFSLVGVDIFDWCMIIKMREVRGLSPVRDKDFRVHMRRLNYLGLVTLTSFGWDDKPRSSVCTHSEHRAHTIKILQSLCLSHKIVDIQRPACTVYPVWSLPVIFRIELRQAKGKKKKRKIKRWLVPSIKWQCHSSKLAGRSKQATQYSNTNFCTNLTTNL